MRLILTSVLLGYSICVIAVVSVYGADVVLTPPVQTDFETILITPSPTFTPTATFTPTPTPTP